MASSGTPAARAASAEHRNRGYTWVGIAAWWAISKGPDPFVGSPTRVAGWATPSQGGSAHRPDPGRRVYIASHPVTSAAESWPAATSAASSLSRNWGDVPEIVDRSVRRT